MLRPFISKFAIAGLYIGIFELTVAAFKLLTEFILKFAIFKFTMAGLYAGVPLFIVVACKLLHPVISKLPHAKLLVKGLVTIPIGKSDISLTFKSAEINTLFASVFTVVFGRRLVLLKLLARISTVPLVSAKDDALFILPRIERVVLIFSLIFTFKIKVVVYKYMKVFINRKKELLCPLLLILSANKELPIGSSSLYHSIFITHALIFSTEIVKMNLPFIRTTHCFCFWHIFCLW